MRRIAGEGSDPKTNVCLPTYLEENVQYNNVQKTNHARGSTKNSISQI